MNIDEGRINVTLSEKPYILVAIEEYEEKQKERASNE